MRPCTAPTNGARECQRSRMRFCSRAENALYSSRHCMTNLWTSTKQRWSIVCRNSWMAFSPRAHRRQKKHEQTVAHFGLNSRFTLTLKSGEKCWWRSKEESTICIAGFCWDYSERFPEDFANMLVTPQHLGVGAEGERDTSVSYLKGIPGLCSTRAPVRLRENSSAV